MYVVYKHTVVNRVTYARGEGVDRGMISTKERGGVKEPALKRASRKMGKVKRRGGRVIAQYSNMRKNFIDTKTLRHQDTACNETAATRGLKNKDFLLVLCF